MKGSRAVPKLQKAAFVPTHLNVAWNGGREGEFAPSPISVGSSKRWSTRGIWMERSSLLRRKPLGNPLQNLSQPVSIWLTYELDAMVSTLNPLIPDRTAGC